MVTTDAYREVAEAAWIWVLDHVREVDGPWLPESVSDGWEDAGPAVDRDSMYVGIAGLAPVLAEIAHSRPLTDAESRLATRIVERLSTMAATRTEASLYDGLAGDVTALRMLAPVHVPAVLHRLAELATPDGWATTIPGAPALCLTDVVMGTAGVVMAATWAGGEERSASRSPGAKRCSTRQIAPPAGLDWGSEPGAPSRAPNYSHGTGGIASALAVAGATYGRPDLVDAAVLGAQHLLAVGTLDDRGFVVPHTIPASKREVEPVTYSWCHGPTGTSHLFAALAHAGVTEVGGLGVDDLRRRCFRSILDSGVPQRLRPGFWDNDGRCCGTAGVGDVLLDGAQDAPVAEEAGELLAAARVMGDALVERSIRVEDRAFWRFVEHRQDPPLLPPGTSWMQGAAGIAAFLLRLARVTDDGLDAPVVDRPDEWWAVPADLRRSSASASFLEVS